MKLKSSNKKSYFLLSSLILLVVLLFALKSNNKKSNKYISAPKGVEQKTTLNFIQLTFSEKNYNKLKNKRDKALSVGVLETNDTDYVPATVTYNGNEYRADVRLKGDWTDHLKGDKWSFRIKLKDDQTIMGMRKFSIHHPRTRGYINEWLYHKAIKDNELIGLRYEFIEGTIHIKKSKSNQFITKEVGLYAIEESFDKRTLESNNRKESIILKFDESKFWSSVKKSIAVAEPSGLYWKDYIDKSDFPITLFSEDKVLQDSVMEGYFKISKNLIYNLKEKNISLENVFDIKKLAMQNAILNLFGATHGNYIINLRFYYNPITSKLEPIAFDGNSGVKLKSYVPFYFLQEEKDSVYMKELAYALEEVGNPLFLNNLLTKYDKDLNNYIKILKTEFKSKSFTPNNLQYNQNIINKELIRLKEKYNLKDIAVGNISNKKEVQTELKKIELPDLSKWTLKNENLNKETELFNNQDVYKISRIESTKPAYIKIDNISVNLGEVYKVSVLVKKTNNNASFGLRIQGNYPDRIDAIFNLNQGKIKDVKKAGSFNNEKATIENVGDGWYKCTLSGTVNSEVIRLIFGPTSLNNRVLNWETPVEDNCDLFILPSSFLLE